MFEFLYLASQSPRRQELLRQIGVKFELLLPTSKENAEALEAEIEGELALDYVRRVTLAKIDAAQRRLLNGKQAWAPILCADTTVVQIIEGREKILGKPKDPQDALRILSHLNGAEHLVHTAVAIKPQPKHPAQIMISSSKVEFSSCAPELLRAYIATGEPMGKAGAYAIQGIGACLIKSIQGSHSGIMGLPLYETSLLLQRVGIQYEINKP